ncbi:MAG: ATP phosphoribosyltransferase [Acidobacteriota bacterium]|nr:ATP phosphoribosyltransferase [Acidobacteriota bacterium]
MKLKMVVPKGRMFKKIDDLLRDSGIKLVAADRSYRPRCSDESLEIKLLKSANIPPLIALNQHDCGFAGADWVREQKADVETIVDLGFDPVRIVAAIPEDWDWNEVKQRHIIVVSEYRNLCGEFLREHGVDFTFLRSYGATEVFPPEDADLIVDNTSTGSTLVANRLKIIGTVMHSATCFIANKRALDDPEKRGLIENLSVLFNSVLEGRKRVLLEMNCPEAALDDLIDMLPCMKAPTIARLYKQDAFAVRSAVLRSQVKDLIPRLRELGASDILETEIRKVIP